MTRLLFTVIFISSGYSFYGQNPDESKSQMIMLGVPASNTHEVFDFYADLENQITTLSEAITDYQNKLDSLQIDPKVSEAERTSQSEYFHQTISQATRMIETNRRILAGKVVVHTAEN
ncbi:MAG: hypothetical protein R3C61_28850 [Bacteroidia bacterium]